MRWFRRKRPELPAPQRITELRGSELPIPISCPHNCVACYTPDNLKELREAMERGYHYQCVICDQEWREHPPWSKYAKFKI